MPNLNPRDPSTGAPAARSMARLIANAMLGTVISWVAAPALASKQPLSEAELSWVTAQGSTQVDTLDEQRFAADIKALGLAPFTAPFYTGGDVMKLVVDIEPFDVKADLSDVIFRNNGGTQSKSMGYLEIIQIDFTGTTLWLWVDSTPFSVLLP